MMSRFYNLIVLGLYLTVALVLLVPVAVQFIWIYDSTANTDSGLLVWHAVSIILMTIVAFVIAKTKNMRQGGGGVTTKVCVPVIAVCSLFSLLKLLLGFFVVESELGHSNIFLIHLFFIALLIEYVGRLTIALTKAK